MEYKRVGNSAGFITVESDYRQAILNVTDTVDDSSVVITATVNGKSANATIAFIPQIADVAVTAQKTNAPADNVSENILQAKVTDAKGKVVPHASVTWSQASGSSATVTSPLTVITDGNGIATLKLVDSAIETVSATARAGDKQDTVYCRRSEHGECQYENR
ncbi:Ig-like domain-containing protein [Pseudescherichia vulneris]